MFSSLRQWLRPEKPTQSKRKNRTLQIEQLEARVVPTITVTPQSPISASSFVEQGGGNETNGGTVTGDGVNTTSGATNSILINPSNPNIAFVGTVAGGIWRSTNFNAGSTAVRWEQINANLPTTFITEMTFDPNDRSFNTIYAGTGSNSSGFTRFENTFSLGVYRVTNANAASVASIGVELLNNGIPQVRVEAVTVAQRNPNIILVATENGLFRSMDRGVSFQELTGNGLPANIGLVSDALTDPNRPLTFYVALPANASNPTPGIYRTDDGGSNWIRIDSNSPGITRPIFGLGNTRVQFGFHDLGNQGVLYVANLSGGQISSVFRYEEDGLDADFDGVIDDANETAWFQMGTPPQVNAGGQGSLHFSIAADTRNKNILYIAGDAGGAVQGLGNVARGTFTGAVNGVPTLDTATWAALLPGNTAPHPDSRDMAILTPVDPSQPVTLIEVNDGGVYRLVNPAAPSGTGAQRWFSLNTNLAVFEYYSGAYDTRRNLVFAGAQDNDSQVQIARNSPTFRSVQGGDGAEQEYSVPGDIRYSQGNNFAIFQRFMGASFAGTQLRLSAPGSTNFADGLESASGGGSDSTYLNGFQGPFPIAANRFLGPNVAIARRAVYESTNMGDNIATVIPAAGIGGEKLPFDNFRTIVYGGMRNLVPLPQIIYAGTDFGRLYLRDVDSGGTGTQVFDLTTALNSVLPTASAGDQVKDVVVDPADYRRVYVLKGNRVLFSADAGSTWTDLTTNLGSLSIQIRALSLIASNETNPTANRVLVAGGLGGVFAIPIGPSFPLTPQWSRFGGTLPNTLVVDLDFYPNTDQDLNAANGEGVLLATTMGRGTFLLSNAENFAMPVTINVVGDDTPNNIRIYDSPTSSSSIVVEDGLGNTITVEKFRVQAINIAGLAGDDTITIGGTSVAANGALDYVNFPISIDAGLGTNTLVLNDSTRTTGTQVTVGATTVGAGSGDTFLASGGSISFGNINNVVLRTGLGNDTVQFDSTSSLVGITLDGGGGTNSLLAPNNPVNNWVVTGGVNGRLNTTAFSNFSNLVGGTGVDNATYADTLGSSNFNLFLNAAAFSGTFVGLAPAGASNDFSAIENVTLDAGDGVNNFNLIDGTGRVNGTMLNPRSGLNYAPMSATSGQFFSIGNILPVVQFLKINGQFTISGDGGTGALDVLHVLAPSSAGIAGAGTFGELVTSNGSDQIGVSDQLVNVQNVSVGPLLNVNIGTQNGSPTFSGIYVRTGNERPNEGDQVTAITSRTTNILIDGGTGRDQLGVQAIGSTTATSVNNPVLGPPQVRVTGQDGGSVGYINVESIGGVQPGALPSTATLVVAPDVGSGPLVQILDAAGNVQRAFLAYAADFFGGVKVALGDVNGDGTNDIITGTGQGSAPHVKVFDGITLQEIFSFYAYLPNVLSGVNVAAGDVNGDGFADIVTGVAIGLPSHVRVFSGADGSELKSFYAYDPNFLSGVSVATGDFNGDGLADIVTGAGPGGGPHVKVFDSLTNGEIRSFFAFDLGFTGGVNVATGNFNGDGVPDIVAAPAISSVPFVFEFDGATTTPIAAFFVNQSFAPDAFSSTPVQQGLRVATADFDNDGQSEIIVGKGSVGDRPRVFIFRSNPVAPVADFLALDGVFAGGIFVGGA